MTENRWCDERFIKCPNCHSPLIVYPYINLKYFKCYNCGFKIKNKSYHLIILKNKYNEKKYF